MPATAARPAKPAAPPPLPARYRPVERVGVGGIGQVWRVEDANLGRDLAVKLLRDDRRTPEHAARLAREALLTGRLQHPGVPPVVEQGVTDDGGPFFAMKLVAGRTLRELLKENEQASAGRQPHERSGRSRGPEAQGADAPRSPDLPRLLSVFRQVCDAVGYAHAAGVIHRDLKPSNVMVGEHGEVQVMDWGMARLVRGEVEGAADGSTFLALSASEPAPDAPGSPPPPGGAAGATVLTPAAAGGGTAIPPSPGTAAPGGSTDAGAPTVTPGAGSTVPDDPLATMTRAGVGLGTPAYMAPEQARGERDLDARADVFGLGAILCTVLTGKAPFAGGDAVDAFRKAAAADLADALARLDARDADDELKDLCRRCLSAAPAARPADGTAVAAAVRGYEDGVRRRLEEERTERAAAEVRAAEEKKRRRVWAGSAALALALLATLGGAGWWYQADRAEKRAAAALAAETARLRAEGAAAEIADLLARAADLRDAARFDAAATLLDGAENRLPDAADAALAATVGQAKKDLALVRRLDEIRLESWQIMNESDDAVKGEERIARSDALYAAAFREYGIDPLGSDVAEAGRQVASSAIGATLLAALDHWAGETGPWHLQFRPNGERLLAVARAADPDPLLDRVRQPDLGSDPAALRKLAAEIDPDKLTPAAILRMVRILQELGDGEIYSSDGSHRYVGYSNQDREGKRACTDAATVLLYRALDSCPMDFWLHLQAGSLFHKGYDDFGYGEAVGHLRAALALRPTTAAAWLDIWQALS